MLDHEGKHAALFAEACKPNARLCLIMELTPRAGVDRPVLRFTDHDQTVRISDGGDPETLTAFLPSNGFTASAFDSATGGAVTNATVTALVTTAIPEADILRGLYRDAELKIWLASWADPAVQPAMILRGWLGEITAADGGFEAEVRGLEDPLQGRIGRAYMARCDAVFGDARCGLDLAAEGFLHSGTISALGTRERWLEVSVAQPDQYFQFGLIEFLDGENQGFSTRILSHVADVVTLMLPPPFVPEIGDAVRLTRGCPKTDIFCQGLGNLVNFRGFLGRKKEGYFLPPPDILAQVPDV